MKVSFFSIFLTMLFAISIFGQSDQPTIGSFDEINGLSKIYLLMDNESKKAIIKQLKKQSAFKIVESPDDAEFYIDYKTISRQNFGFGGTTETGQMDIFVYRDKLKVVAWSESTTGGGFNGDTARKLINKFLKAFKSLESK